jgi:hypothetical protein
LRYYTDDTKTAVKLALSRILFLIVPETIFVAHPLGWWNWQTHQLEVLAP